MDDERRAPAAPLTLAQARSEFEGQVPRLADSSTLELAAVGAFRRSGVLTAVSLSYFDLRVTAVAPTKPEFPVPDWLSDWIGRLVHPLLEGMVHVWTRAEFGGDPPSAELMLRTLVSSKVEPHRVDTAMLVDGVAVAGLNGDSDERVLRAIEFGGTHVLVQIPVDLSLGTPQLTSQ